VVIEGEGVSVISFEVSLIASDLLPWRSESDPQREELANDRSWKAIGEESYLGSLEAMNMVSGVLSRQVFGETYGARHGISRLKGVRGQCIAAQLVTDALFLEGTG
jgi:hypothetical protein